MSMAIDITDLSGFVERLAKQDQQALIRGIHRTLAMDAHRWIQWSIRGGTAPPIPERRYKRKGPARKKAGKAPSKPKNKRPSKPKKSKTKSKQPEPTPVPPGYRQPIDTGDYAGSWKHVLTETGGHFYSAASPPIKAGVIELGRRPAPIPITPLTDWVRRKLGISDEAEARGVAHAISRKASKTKRPGLYVLARAKPKIQESLNENVRAELLKAAGG